jgi:hypothetical protein
MGPETGSEHDQSVLSDSVIRGLCTKLFMTVASWQHCQFDMSCLWLGLITRSTANFVLRDQERIYCLQCLDYSYSLGNWGLYCPQGG